MNQSIALRRAAAVSARARGRSPSRGCGPTERRGLPEPAPARGREARDPAARDAARIAAFRGGPTSYGDFAPAGPISEANNLVAMSLRPGGKRLLRDPAAARIANIGGANRLPTHDYRPGREL